MNKKFITLIILFLIFIISIFICLISQSTKTLSVDYSNIQNGGNLLAALATGADVPIKIDDFDGFDTIFITHGHFDHIMGLKVLKERWPDLAIAIHKNDCQCIGSNSLIRQRMFLSAMGADDYELLDAVSNLIYINGDKNKGLKF